MQPRLTAEQINEREPAFARPATMINENMEYAVQGLTKLEYAAIHIAAGCAADLTRFSHKNQLQMIADRSVAIARAILAQTGV